MVEACSTCSDNDDCSDCKTFVCTKCNERVPWDEGGDDSLCATCFCALPPNKGCFLPPHLTLRKNSGVQKDISLEQVIELYAFLSDGSIPDRMMMGEPPRLGQDLAFSIIWFLQEYMDILPCSFEQCCDCKELYDADSEGGSIERQGAEMHCCGACYDREKEEEGT